MWRVVWQHPTGPDESIGDEWDRESAEWIADMLRSCGCRNVRLVKWRC